MSEFLLDVARVQKDVGREEEEEEGVEQEIILKSEIIERHSNNLFIYVPTKDEISDMIISKEYMRRVYGTWTIYYTLGEILLNEIAQKKNIVSYIIQFPLLIDKLTTMFKFSPLIDKLAKKIKFHSYKSYYPYLVTEFRLKEFLNSQNLTFFQEVYKMIIDEQNEEWGIRNVFPSKLNLLTLYNPYNLEQIITLEELLYEKDKDRTRKGFTSFNGTVISGKIKKINKEVVVKFSPSGNNPLFYFDVMKIYQLVKSAGVRTTKMYKHFRFMGMPVLVMEKVISISYENNPNFQIEESVLADMGVQLLEQLRLLHKIGIHNDIKPENIAYRNNPKTGKKEFMFIDLDDISMIKMGFGFEREIYTEIFMSQVKDTHTIATRENDIMELLYSLNSYILVRRIKEIDYLYYIEDKLSKKEYIEEIKKVVRSFEWTPYKGKIEGKHISLNLSFMRQFLNKHPWGIKMDDEEEENFYSTLQDFLRPFLTSKKIIS